jgi:hypothetical protein
MSETNIKNELLKQNGKSAVDQEASRLHAIIAAEQRRVRRLLFLTIGVWAVWILMISLSFGIPMILAHASPPQATTQPAATTPSAGYTPSTAGIVFKGIVGIAVIALFLGLPVAGIVLAIMLIVTRHTASVNQVRASLASIDAQLRMLGAAGVKSEEAK